MVKIGRYIQWRLILGIKHPHKNLADMDPDKDPETQNIGPRVNITGEDEPFSSTDKLCNISIM